MTNNNHINFLVPDAKFILQFVYESLNEMYLSWEDSLEIYIEMFKKKKLVYVSRETNNYKCSI